MLIKSEIIKLYSVPSTFYYLITLAATMIVVVLRQTEVVDWNYLLTGSDLATIVAIFAAATMVGSDISKKTVLWSYLSTPHRVRLMIVQLAVISFSIIAAVLIGIAVLAGLKFASPFDLTPDRYLLSVFGQLLIMPLLAALLAVLLKNGPVAALIVIVDMVVVEFGLVQLDTSWSRAMLHVMPLTNVRSLEGSTWIDQTPAMAALLLVCLVLLLGSGAAWRVSRRPA